MKTTDRFAFYLLVSSLAFSSIYGTTALAGAGTDAANFLELPVGAAPASLGSAYAPRASNAYAPVINAAGLGFVDGVHVSASQLSYLQGIHYDYLGLAVPLGGSDESTDFSFDHRRGLGASVQYLGSGNIVARDEFGTVTGSFSTAFAAYSLAFGQSLTDDWAIGLTGKAITETIAGASARGYAADVGTSYRATSQWTLAATALNLGTPIKFVQESDPLPTEIHAGALYQVADDLNVSAEAVDRLEGPLGISAGAEWSYENFLVLRGGVDSSHAKGLSTLSAFTAGGGIRFFGQEFSIAWVPYGDLGNTFYFSLDLRFGGSGTERTIRAAQNNDDPESHALNDMLSDDEKKAWPH